MLKKIQTFYNGRNAILMLFKRKFTGHRLPVRVSWLITKRCNLRCFYCYALDTINSTTIREPSLTDLKNIADQIYQAGCRWVDILGGEPLLRDDIDELINYLHRKGMFIELTTNGYFIDKHLPALKKVDHLCISLDGDKETNDRSRGNGSFEKIKEGVECALQNKLNVRIHATLCRKTNDINSLKFLAEFCRARKIKFNYSENGLPDIENRNPDFLLTQLEEHEFYTTYIKLKKQGHPIASSDIAINYARQWPLPGQTTIYHSDLEKIPKTSYYPCLLGRNQCFIDVNGRVYACTKKWGYGKNLYETGFQSAWNYLADLDCIACKELGTIEQSVITDLNLNALLNAVLNFTG